MENQTILITGAAGSIGSGAKPAANAHGQKLTLFDWWENGMFELRKPVSRESSRRYP